MPATTTLLGLVTPTQGTLSGTWGDTVNYGITDYVDIAVAGTLSFDGDGAITLANTTGSASGNGFTSTTAQYMVIRVTGTLTTTKSITGPSYSKLYLVDNAATGGSVSFLRSGQATPVTIAAGESAFVYYNGTDYIKVTSDLILGGYTTTATAAGTTTLTAASTQTQFFTGSTTQTVVLPVAATLVLGSQFTFHNNSTGDLTINSSGGNFITTVTAATTVTVTCILTSGTTAASWDADFTGFTNSLALPPIRGGTGISNNAASTLAISGNFATTLTVSGTTGITLPTTGTLSTLAGTETLTNKTLTSPTLTTPALGTPSQGVLSSCTVDGTYSVGFRKIPPVGVKTSSYTLAAADAGKYVQVSTSGAIVVPTGIFSDGDAITIYNNTSGNITMTTSAVSAYLAGTNSLKTSVTVATRGVSNILFYSASECVITGNVS
jgi:hypothetical protein